MRGAGETAALCWIGGEVVPLDDARVPVRDRGFLFGEGLFETVRLVAGRPWRLARHLARLEEGARALGIGAPPLATIERAVGALLDRYGERDGVLKVIATAGDPPDISPALVALATPSRPLPPRAREEGVTAEVAGDHPGAGPLAGRKTLARFEWTHARRRAAAAGHWEAIFLDRSDAAVLEGSASNLFAVRAGTLATAAVERGVLPGIARAAVIELARAAGLGVEERAPEWERFVEADEAFLTNALVGVLPLRAVQGRPIGSGAPGPVTRDLAARLEALVRAECGGPP